MGLLVALRFATSRPIRVVVLPECHRFLVLNLTFRRILDIPRSFGFVSSLRKSGGGFVFAFPIRRRGIRS
jgi:hypothetical protein